MSERIGHKDVVAMTVLVLAGVGIPLWLAAAAGAIGVPSNDDWVYMRAATNLFNTGRVDIAGHTAAIIGQLALAQPLLWLSAGNLWALTAFGLVMAAIGIVATHLLARRFLGLSSAIIVVLLVLVFPGFARESASFMTDGPAYTLGVLCLLLGTRWLQGDGGRVMLVASVGAGLLAVSIREFAIAAPVAILVAASARNRAQERIVLAGLSIVLAAGLVGILAVTVSLTGAGTKARLLGRLPDIGPAFATLAAVLLPATVLHIGQRLANFRPEQVIVGAALGCAALLAPHGPILGNLWTPAGLTNDTVLAGSRPLVIGELAWGLSLQLTVFAAILGATVALSWGQRNLVGISSVSTAKALLIRTMRSSSAPLLIFLVAYALELVIYDPLGGLFDRYLYPMVPAAGILLLRGSTRRFPSRSSAFTRGAFVWLAASSFVIAANSFAYDAARYREGNAAVAMGYDAMTVDAGYEWIGSHFDGVGNVAIDPSAINRFRRIWPSFRACAVLSNSPMSIASYELIGVNRKAYRQYLFFGPAEPLYLYGALIAGCPTPRPIVDPLSPG